MNNLPSQNSSSTESQFSSTNEFSLSELFSRDPLTLTREERDAIIAGLRADRLRFAQAEAEGKKAPTKSKKVKAPSTLTLADILGEVQV